jgi:5,10-methylenetetrahydrofolate reductase
MMISEIAKQKDFFVTLELSPPKGVNYKETLRVAEEISQHADAMNVTESQRAVMRMGSLAICHLLTEKGIEPIVQFTCRDRNRIALQSELLNAFALGIKNVLCVTGDHVALGDHPDAKQVFDLDSVSLLHVVQRLNEGFDMRGNPLNGATELCPGAVVNPNALPIEPQLLKMKRKIEAGARFFQSQAVFEVSKIEPFTKIARDMNVPFLCGVLILRSPATARFVRNHVSGVHISEELVAQLENSRDPTENCIEMSARIIREARKVCQGVHLMGVGQDSLAQEILREAGIG